MIKEIYLIQKWDPNRFLRLPLRVNLALMAMKRLSTIPKLQDWCLTIKWFNIISRTLIGVCYTSEKMQSAYSPALAYWATVWVLFLNRDVANISAPADWATTHSLGGSLTTLQRCSQRILQPQPTGPQWGVLFLNRDAASIFSPSWLGHNTPASLGRGLTTLQRYSQRILRPPSTGLKQRWACSVLRWVTTKATATIVSNLRPTVSYRSKPY